jgi:hypothetical protein
MGRSAPHVLTTDEKTFGNDRFPTNPVTRIAAILRYGVPFHIHRVNQSIDLAHLATGLRELSDRVIAKPPT